MRKITIGLLVFCLPFMVAAELQVHQSPSSQATARAVSADNLLLSYRRLLPLEGGSNFRDLGGYPTKYGRRVKRGLLFRSGAMTGLTDADITYLDRFGFRTVVDLRSTDELELYPNPWVRQRDIAYRYHPYSMLEMMRRAMEGGSLRSGNHGAMYASIAENLKPQLRMYFDTLLAEAVPAVVNCSAGQDRTGVASALLLSVLGVDRELIYEDYLLSTDFRRPLIESGAVDLEAAAKTNSFAAMMLRYGEGKDKSRPGPLVSEEGVPFLKTALDAIDTGYGGVAEYLEKEIGVSMSEQQRLRELYLES